METLKELYEKFSEENDFSERGVSKNFIPGEGSLEANLFIIGEAPGVTEDLLGHPFIGTSGNILNDLLKSIKIKREDIFITNLFKFRPPNNRTPFPDEIKQSVKLLSNELKIIQPKVIVPMGKTATSVFFPSKNFQSVVGKVIPRRSRIIIPTWHPATAAYEEETYLPLLQEHFKLIGRTLNA